MTRTASMLVLLLPACGGTAARRPADRPRCEDACAATFDQTAPPRLPDGFAYRRCDPWHVVETPGDHPVSGPDLIRFNARRARELLPGGPGGSIGIGGCCPADAGPTTTICLSVLLNPCTTSMEAVIERIAAAAREDGLGGARITIELTFGFCGAELLSSGRRVEAACAGRER